MILYISCKLQNFRILIFYWASSISTQFMGSYIHHGIVQRKHSSCTNWSVLRVLGWLSTSNLPFLNLPLLICPWLFLYIPCLHRGHCVFTKTTATIFTSGIFPSWFSLLYLSIKTSKREKANNHIAISKMSYVPQYSTC